MCEAVRPSAVFFDNATPRLGPSPALRARHDAQITPLPVLDTSQLRSALSGRSQQAQRGENAAGRSEWGHLIDPGAYGDSSVASAAAARAAASSAYTASSR